MIATYIIPADNRDAVTLKIAEMGKKAAKLGTAPIRATFAHDHLQTWTEPRDARCPDGPRIERSREWLRLTIEGETASINGYYFQATLHHTTDGNIIAAIPGFEIPREYRNAPPACHHCKTLRRRSATYLLGSKDGLIQVGRACLADFLGAHDPHKLAAWAEALGAFHSWCQSAEETLPGQRIERCTSLLTFLKATAAVIRMDGWVSKTKARETNDCGRATAETAWSLAMEQMTEKETARYLDRHEYLEEDVTMATAVAGWAETTLATEDETRNDYMHNLSVIARANLVSYRTAGLAASMIAAYRKTLADTTERQKAATSTSAHVGAIGDRLRDLAVTVSLIVDLEPSDYGPRQLMKFADDAGNLFVWFTGVCPSVEIGQRLWVTGTVKRHNSYNGARQTELSRCAISREEPAPAKPKKVKKAPAQEALPL